jgi:hypothetical protein
VNKENGLFHYTTAKGLMGILHSNTIWASAHHCTNDLSEFKIASQLVTKMILSLTRSHSSASLQLNRMVSHTIRKTIEKSLSNINCFITSFCIAQDDEVFKNGLLSQWRSYGSSQGYAIVFNKEKLIDELKKSNITGVLSSVSYIEDDNVDLKHFQKDYIQEVINPLQRSTVPKALPPIHIDETNLDTFMDLHKNFISKLCLIEGDKISDMYHQFLNLITLTKNQHFKEENEHRLSYYVKDTKGLVHSFEKDGLITPYVSPKIDLHSCISKIIIGPSFRSDDRKRSVEMLIKSITDKNIRVVESKIPYA